MDYSFIDFNSPKQRRGEEPLIPWLINLPVHSHSGALTVGSNNNNNSSSSTENNPFDFVVGQVAANTAAENDPFEIVLNDALNQEIGTDSQKVDIISILDNQASPCGQRNSQSMPDLRLIHSDTLMSKIKLNSDNEGNHKSESSFTCKNNCDKYLNAIADKNVKSEDWDYLDDIPPPDSLLNSSIDVSNFPDDSLSTSINCQMSEKENLLVNVGYSEYFNTPSKVDKSVLDKHLDVMPQSEDDLKSLAKKQIEDIINRAESKLKSNLHDAFEKKRFSNHNISAHCTPKSSRDIFFKREEVPESFQKWSENEMKSLTSLLDSTPSGPSCSASTFIHKLIQEKNEVKSDDVKENLSSIEVNAVEEFSFQLSGVRKENTGVSGTPSMKDPSNSSAQQMWPLNSESDGKRSSKCTSSTHEVLKRSPVLPSPVLLPLPLCEDAVRNLSLCSKYSPVKTSNSSINTPIVGPEPEKHQSQNISSKKEDCAKHSKLTLRKLATSKPRSKLAPLKATAPVQNMTRTRSSLSTTAKPEVKKSACFTKKPTSMESCSKVLSNGSLRMPSSPSRILSGSLPNLSAQARKLPTKLPSPRRPSGCFQESMNFKKQLDNVTGNLKGIHNTAGGLLSSSLPSSPRPIYKSSPCGKSNGNSRVLTDLNASRGARKTLKCRNLQTEISRKESVLTEKENVQ